MIRVVHLILPIVLSAALQLRAQVMPVPAGDPDNCRCPELQVTLDAGMYIPPTVCRGAEMQICANVTQTPGMCGNKPFSYDVATDLEFHWQVLNVLASPQSGKTRCARFTTLSSGEGTVVFSVNASRHTPRYCSQNKSTSIVFAVVHADLDLDSDNNNGFGSPAQSAEEDSIEDQPGLPGKIMVVNNGDADMDGIPNFADGFDLFGQESRHAGGFFVPIHIKLPPSVNPHVADITFFYPSSPPNNTTRTGDGSRFNPYMYEPDHGGILRLWNAQASSNRRGSDLASGGSFIQPGTPYPLRWFGTNTIFQVYAEAVHPSSQPGDAPVSIALDPDGQRGPLPVVCADTANITAFKAQIGVDWNRDREVGFNRSDATSPRRYYRFWVNNDRDTGDDHEAEDLNPADGTVDAQDSFITSMRDLEDFSPLGLMFEGPSCIMQMISTGAIKVGLSSRSHSGIPGIQLFPAFEQTGCFSYLNDESPAQGQAKQHPFNRSIGITTGFSTLPITGTGGNILSGLPSSGGGRFLVFEGRGAGRARYALAFSMTQNFMGDASFAYIETADIKRMYEHWTVGDNTTSDVADIPTRASETNGFRYAPESPEQHDYIVFVHGWRMRPWERRHFAETAFKRLFWSRYDGRFGLFSWPTDYADNLIIDPRNYDRSEYRAWNSAPALRNLVLDLHDTSPGRVRILAHSMGNVVASEALRLEAESDSPERIVHSYAASQAATVAHAYDAGAETIESDLTTDTPEVYAGYPPTGRPYFEGIANAASKIINLFNEEDYALKWWLYNQDVKPDIRYDYEFIGLNLGQRHWTHNPANGDFRILDFPEDAHEIYSLIAESRSRALGADASANGAIQHKMNLKKEHGYDDNRYDHSAQFNSLFLHRAKYWSDLMDMFLMEQIK